MAPHWRRVLPVMIVLDAVLGVVSILGAPPIGGGVGIWPVGVSTIALVLVPRASRDPVARELRWILPLGLVAITAVTISLRRPLLLSVGLALSFIVASVLCAWLLDVTAAGDNRRRMLISLRTTDELWRYLFACFASGLIGGIGGGLTSLLTGVGHPLTLALAIGVPIFGTQLALLPLISSMIDHGSSGNWVEVTLQWATLLGVGTLVFAPHHLPSVLFLVIPALAWGAFRASPRQALVQMLLVQLTAVVATPNGHGPLADITTRFGYAPEVRNILLAAFVSTCALMTVPLVVQVGQYAESVREVRRERDRVRSIVDAATGVAIIGTDRDGRITSFNPGAERLLAYSAAEVLGQNVEVLLAPDSRAAATRTLSVRDDMPSLVRALCEPQHRGTHVQLRRGDGAVRTHAVNLNRITDDQQRVIGWVNTSEDVTDELEAKRALQEALASEQAATERLREVDSVKERFVTNVSHELRTPITTMVGYLELLRDGSFGDLNAKQADATQRIFSNSQRLLSLIDDLLLLSRVGEHGIALEQEGMDLRTVVDRAHRAVAPNWLEGRHLDVRVNVPTCPVLLRGDRRMLERVVENLLTNAVKFTADGGAVEVRLEAHDDVALLSVTDTGVGIAQTEQNRLFTRFFRGQQADQDAVQGTGIGLNMCKKIVEQHNGLIELESTEGVGTTVRVILPMRARRPVARRPRQLRPPEPFVESPQTTTPDAQPA